jgi:DNA transposition AAA+ family ATPase
MAYFENPKEGEEPNDEALLRRLMQFVSDSELSFYRIASRIGTSGVILSMWLAGAARPDKTQLTAIDRLLTKVDTTSKSLRHPKPSDS